MWCLIAFILTFFVTRTIIRYIRSHADSDGPRKWWQPRNISVSEGGGLHIHHVVIGVILVMVSGVDDGDDGGRRGSHPSSRSQQSFSGSARHWCSTSSR